MAIRLRQRPVQTWLRPLVLPCIIVWLVLNLLVASQVVSAVQSLWMLALMAVKSAMCSFPARSWHLKAKLRPWMRVICALVIAIHLFKKLATLWFQLSLVWHQVSTKTFVRKWNVWPICVSLSSLWNTHLAGRSLSVLWDILLVSSLVNLV